MPDGNESPAPRALVNVNVGVLGHVDSGKTHLVRVLSTHLSTAALDKHPQSQQRGMTLDLGFSSFQLPSLTRDSVPNSPEIQITLVDCPGHASLFKTILGGVHIIDSVLLVVDVQKGLQPQSIECLLLAELAVGAQLVIALNKIDLLVAEEKEARILAVQRQIRHFLKSHFKIFQTRDVEDVPIIPVAAAPGATDDASQTPAAMGIERLVDAIQTTLPMPQRDGTGPLCYAIDHCFSIQGNGTILTGTVLNGSVRVGDEIELPGLRVTKKIKSMQMFKRAVTEATQGDRVALRVNGLDASLVERGMAITPGSLPFIKQVVIPVNQIAFFQAKCKSGGKVHVTIGHTTVVAVATYFKSAMDTEVFNRQEVYRPVAEIESIGRDPHGADVEDRADAATEFKGFALLQFEQPVVCPPKVVVVCSRFDLDPKKFHCRLAYHGEIHAIVWDDDDEITTAHLAPSLSLSELKIGSVKERSGVVDRMIEKNGSVDVLGRDMFAKDVDWQVYTHKTVLFEGANALGRILGPFGKSGKFKIELLKNANASSIANGGKIIMRFVKLATIKPLKRANDKSSGGGIGHAGSKAQAGAASNSKGRNLVQDDRILYPEAFKSSSDVGTKDNQPKAHVSPLPVVEPTKEQQNASAQGRIERLKGETTADGRNPFVIVSGLFNDETSASAAVGSRVRCVLSQQPGVVEHGEVEKPFGKAGKVRVTFAAHGGTLAQVGDVIELL